MKWINILWSIVTLTALTLLVVLLTRRSTGIIAGWFPFALIGWIILTIITPFILLARFLGMITSPAAFFYILTGTANFAFALSGWITLATGSSENRLLLASLLGFNAFFAAFIFFDSCAPSKKTGHHSAPCDHRT
jgi:hypothetical protein